MVCDDDGLGALDFQDPQTVLTGEPQCCPVTPCWTAVPLSCAPWQCTTPCDLRCASRQAWRAGRLEAWQGLETLHVLAFSQGSLAGGPLPDGLPQALPLVEDLQLSGVALNSTLPASASPLGRPAGSTLRGGWRSRSAQPALLGIGGLVWGPACSALGVHGRDVESQRLQHAPRQDHAC